MTGAPPTIAGPDPITYSLAIEAQDDGTNPVWKLEVINLELS
jgi:hypothetical protein